MNEMMYDMLKKQFDNQNFIMNEMYGMIQDKLNTQLALISKQNEALERIASALEKLSGSTNTSLSDKFK